ncbi:hypothetical protein BIY23_03430 [Wolbachia pipientis]|uniref:Uncharacterized protein n=1 Tax=Wolbachia pipientis TaxID=955 RepID=A0A1E7QJD9_WOLPI|nr:hypothetical protein [Wolbachia pipientis]OEY86583.1 hypothetical protein BIY23_03430 [Wolbachia pipientis]
MLSEVKLNYRKSQPNNIGNRARKEACKVLGLKEDVGGDVEIRQACVQFIHLSPIEEACLFINDQEEFL